MTVYRGGVEQEVKLDKPGAGLPPVEAFVSRHLFFPLYCATHSWEQSMVRFQDEGSRILDLAVHLPPDQVRKPVLIPRLPGMEDSSRNWSVAMTLEHLVIVGQQIQAGIIALSRGAVPDGKADVAAVKPQDNRGIESIESFRSFLDDYCYALQEKVENRESDTTFEHPWFGELTARQWCALAALHQGIHRRQIQSILKRL